MAVWSDEFEKDFIEYVVRLHYVVHLLDAALRLDCIDAAVVVFIDSKRQSPVSYQTCNVFQTIQLFA